jgi:hypothetical protein
MQMRILTLVPLCFAIACAAVATPPPAPVVPLVELATNIEAYRGQVVRTCGPRLIRPEGDEAWQLTIPRAFGHHPAGVRILGCPMAQLSNDESCVTGRVARRDGSTEEFRDGEARAVSSAVISSDWFVHAQCPSGAGLN